MKFSLLVTAILVYTFGIAQADTTAIGTKTIKDGVIYYRAALPLFEIDSCMEDLLFSIEEADQNASYFGDQIGTRFYSLETRQNEKYEEMDIWPVRKSRSDFFDYYGAIQIKDAVFLLRGNFRSEKLFHRVKGSPIEVSLQRPQKNKGMDEIDKTLFELVLNPALIGTYIQCTGLKIVTSIYIENKLDGFEVPKKRKELIQDTLGAKEMKLDSLKFIYNTAFNDLSRLLSDNGSFKKSVFITESAFFGNKLPIAEIDRLIKGLSELCREWYHNNRLKEYRYNDSTNLSMNLAIYRVLKDTVTITGPNSEKYYHLPFDYDFNDFFGRQQWSNMFVSKLLISQRGNCHSMPYLYKILADELGATCWLSLAPNHVYIKNRSKRLGWYNTELTSGSFPIDAWITASGYIPIKAVQNGIYMDTLSNQQSIALCILDLAKGYEFQTKKYDDGFILKCCDLVLQYHPANVQALLLKAEVLKRNYENSASKENAKEVYKQMEALYVKLFDLGYREMPEKMYMNWLLSITNEKDKYMNKDIKKVLTK